MDTKIALITLLALTGTALFFMDNREVPMSQLENSEDEFIFQLYQSWKTKYQQNVNDQLEDAYRLSVFKENFYFVEQHNAESTGEDALKLELNEFGAMTNEEFASSMFSEKFADLQEEVDVDEEELDEEDEALVEDIWGWGVRKSADWRGNKGAVNTPRKQGHCGACWTFSSTAGLEFLAWKESGGKQSYKFSEQDILSCAQNEHMHGCDGGSTTSAYKWTATNGVQNDTDYPYTDAAKKVASPCMRDASKVAFKNPGGNQRTYGKVGLMQRQALKQVLSVSIHATSQYVQLYKTGIITSDHCPTRINHAVNIVGYNMKAKTPYWIMKNSWGPDWGQGGFFYLKASSGKGTCGVNQYVDSPQMKAPEPETKW